MSEEKAKELGVEPLATWVAGALAGVEPEVMGLGPIAATKKVMAKTGLTVDDMDLIDKDSKRQPAAGYREKRTDR